MGWLLLWQIISLGVGNRILLVGPVETLSTLIRLLVQAEFWEACIGSLLRIGLGFGTGAILGTILAAQSARYSWLEEILAPVIILVKAVPVASFVVIFLIWWGSASLAAVISFCMVFPVMYVNTLEGIKSTDKKLLEMAQVFRISKKDQFFYIYRPAIKSFWDSGIKLAAGMSWKSGVAAEVIGLPEHAIGEQLYMSKIYLDTAGVLAWTLAIILLSMGFEKGIMCCWRHFCQWQPACRNVRPIQIVNGECAVTLTEVTKRFGSNLVIDGLNAEYLPGKIYHFNSPSGSGKTTLFRLLAELEQPDAGSVSVSAKGAAFLFQEDRLCEDYSALKNVELVTGDKELSKQHLLQLLEEDDIDKPCRELSGGMKRRVALARTIAAQAELILLDEPYNGLDEANRVRVRNYIEKNCKDSIVLIASHIE